MRKLYCFFLLALLPQFLFAYTQQRVSVHDPSIVWDNAGTYYVFGSHEAWAKSTDLMNWSDVPVAWRTTSSASVTCETAFNVNATTTIKVGGANRDFKNGNGDAFDVEAYSAAGYVKKEDADPETYQISGNLWAPDVIWNPTMEKWCMYLSINGDNANCSIVLLTADNIEGPYLYQGPVVFSGFNLGSTTLSYKYTDLEIALGTQASLPSRYAVGNLSGWRQRWPNAIDPCVFYDQEGKLWMSYGSWHGGIYMLELDEKTGLRDYDVTYTYTEGDKGANDVRQDPYFGKKIAGGRGVSGEASYVKYIDGYYYLFVTYGGLKANAGYQMRVFRSTSPTGPYNDPYNGDGVAIYPEASMNYGPDGTRKTNRGENIFGAYGDWGFMATGDDSERSQGHNSVITNGDQTFMVYHTRFQNRSIVEAHELRVHQVFKNSDGWLCAAPFEYTGETVTNTQIKTTQQVATANIPGNYKILLHDKNLDHANKQLKTPLNIELKSDGTIVGDKTGTWSVTAGTSYISIKIDENSYQSTYNGVLVEQTMEPTDVKVIAFTAMNRKKEDRNSGDGGNTIWGYKAPSTIGATDKGWAEAGSYTTPLKLSTNSMVTYNLEVNRLGSGDYAGLVINLSKTAGPNENNDNACLFLRSSDWAFHIGTQAWWAGSIINANTFGATATNTVLEGATVAVKVRRDGTKAIVQTDITKSETTYHHYMAQDLGSTDDIYVLVCGDNAQLTLNDFAIENYQVNGVLHGINDNSGTFGAGSHTDYTIAPDGMMSFHFINYTNKLNPWNNWVFEMEYDGKYSDVVAGGGNWGALQGGDGAANVVDTGWPTINGLGDKMDGADVVLTITRSGATVTGHAVMTPTSGDSFTRDFSFTSTVDGFASAPATIRLLTEGGHLDLLSAKVGTTISAYDWSTFVCGDYALDFSQAPDGLTAYAVTGHDGTNINKVEVASAVPAGTPLLLKGDANTTYFIPVAASGTAPTVNLLKAGTNVIPESGKTKYALSVESGAAHFKKITSARAIPVGKAYLEFSEEIAARELGFDGFDGGDATGINMVNGEGLKVNGSEVYYDLQGRRVLYPKKGLYIVNGKKVVIK